MSTLPSSSSFNLEHALFAEPALSLLLQSDDHPPKCACRRYRTHSWQWRRQPSLSGWNFQPWTPASQNLSPTCQQMKVYFGIIKHIQKIWKPWWWLAGWGGYIHYQWCFRLKNTQHFRYQKWRYSPIKAVCVSAYVFGSFPTPQKWPEIRSSTSLLRHKIGILGPQKENFSSSDHLGLFIFQLFILGPPFFGILAPQVGLFGLPVLGAFQAEIRVDLAAAPRLAPWSWRKHWLRTPEPASRRRTHENPWSSHL